MEDHVLFNVILAHACAMSIIIYYILYICIHVQQFTKRYCVSMCIVHVGLMHLAIFI